MNVFNWRRYSCLWCRGYHFCDELGRCIHCGKALPGHAYCDKVTPKQLREETERGHRQNSPSREGGTRALSAGGANGSADRAVSGEAAGERASVEIVAWRAWSLLPLATQGQMLGSLNHYGRWEGPVFRADERPTRNNTNGVYAMRSLADVPVTPVWGEVALSGVVVEGDRGYRGEAATIRSLYIAREHRAVAPDGYHPPGTWTDWPDDALVQALEERYQVKVTVSEPRADLAHILTLGQPLSQNAIQLAQQFYAFMSPGAQGLQNLLGQQAHGNV